MRIVIALLCVALSGCAAVAKMESGEQTIGGRLVVHLDGA